MGHVAVNGHLPGWRGRADAELVAAADSREDGRARFTQMYPGARWYPSAEALFEGEGARLDFVDVATPPASHAGLCRGALERGLHVLCEKPLVFDRRDLEGLAALAGERDRALVTVHNWKHAPALSTVTGLLRAGAVGEVRSCRWETLRCEPAVAAGEAGNWRVDPAQSGGGILVDHGWHALYVVSSWLGGSPRSVRAKLETRRHEAFPAEDTATLALDYGGATAEIFLTWAADERRNRVSIEGSSGRLTLDGGFVTLSAAGRVETWSRPSLAEGSHHPDWFGGVLEEFLGEIREPSRPQRNLREAAFCASALELAGESSRRGGAAVPWR